MFEGYSSMPIPTRTGILEFIKTSLGCQFVIPIYQRNYTWIATKEVDRFLCDFKSILIGENNRHFLGIIIYLGKNISSNHQEFSVVDGQQRLTTTFLSLYALKHLAEENNNIDLSNEINELYLINKYIKEDYAKFKLKPLINDDNVYTKIIENNVSGLNNEERCSNVYKNYNYIKNFFNDLLKEYKYSLNDIHEALQKLYIVNIPLLSDDNPQQIFECINSTGAPLYSSDLIRNFMLMNIVSEKQDFLYKEYWQKIEKLLKEPKKIEEFFRFYLAIKNFYLPNKKDIYKTFKNWFIKEGKDIEEIFKNIVSYATYFYDIYLKPISNDDLQSIKNFRMNKSIMPAPFLMEMYNLYKNNTINKETIEKIISIIDAYLIRRWLCGKDTSSISRFFPTLLKSVLDKTNNNYDNIFEYVKVCLVNSNKANAMGMPTDDDLHEFLLKNNAYTLECTRTILDRIETEGNTAPVDLSKLSVEHLLPQTPTEFWQKKVPEGQYEKYLNLIGNLTLASKSDNSKMHNNNWNTKKEILKDTAHLKLNKDILECKDWTYKNIIKRSEDIINQIIKLYPYQEAKNIKLEKFFISLNKNGIVANGYLYENGTVEILQESMISTNYKSYLSNNKNNEIYQYLLENDYIEELDSKTIFKKSYIFNSISSAAGFICNGSRNGWEYFKTEDGKELDDIRKIIEKVNNN